MVQGQYIHSYQSFYSFKKYKCFYNNEIYVFLGEKRKKKTVSAKLQTKNNKTYGEKRIETDSFKTYTILQLEH